MTSTDNVRNSVIDKLLAIQNTDFLKALDKMIESAKILEDTVTLTEEQKIMLAMSDKDISEGKIINQETLSKRELEWLKRK